MTKTDMLLDMGSIHKTYFQTLTSLIESKMPSKRATFIVSLTFQKDNKQGLEGRN